LNSEKDNEILFGNLRTVPLREKFPSEEQDFTPWLKQNLHHLEKLLKISIKDSEREYSVGKYECDIFAHDVVDRTIVIENQYDKSDQRHLGELETYATNLGADIVVWIAEDFNDEHLAVLRDRNLHSSNRFYFAIKVNILQIDNSKPAIIFTLKTQPERWDSISQTHTISDKSRKYVELFNKIINEYAKIKTGFSKPKARPQNYIQFGAGKYGFKYVWYFEEGKWPTVSFETGTTDKKRSKAFFEYLLQNETELKNKLPDFMPYDRPDFKHSSLLFYYSNQVDILTMSENEEKNVIKWMVETMNNVEDVISKYVEEWKE